MAKLNQAGLDLIKSFESCRLTAYPDPATKDDPVKKGKPWTIGWGHTGKEVVPGLTWSQRKCDEVLKEDCDKIVRHINVHLMLPESVNDNQFSAMVSFAFNLGVDDLDNIIDAVGVEGFPKKIQEYVWAGPKGKKKIMNGLVLRRKKEAELFNTPVEKPYALVKNGGDFPVSSRRCT